MTDFMFVIAVSEHKFDRSNSHTEISLVFVVLRTITHTMGMNCWQQWRSNSGPPESMTEFLNASANVCASTGNTWPSLHDGRLLPSYQANYALRFRLVSCFSYKHKAVTISPLSQVAQRAAVRQLMLKAINSSMDNTRARLQKETVMMAVASDSVALHVHVSVNNRQPNVRLPGPFPQNYQLSTPAYKLLQQVSGYKEVVTLLRWRNIIYINISELTVNQHGLT